ncbi:MAG: NADH-quinone oxidoreductase subunit N [Actinomycetota bacterium]|nr:NADH-quinone oxidoreductase subunit N [Actinomycetota bacterium]
MPVGDVAGEIALVLGAAVIIVVVLFVDRRRQWIGAPIAVAACGVSAGLIAVRLATTAQTLTWEGSWSLDRAAGWAELVILATTVITVALSPEWFATDARHGEWYALLLLSAAGAMAMASAADSLELVLGVLLSSTTGYVLAAYHRRSALSVEAGAKYFLVGALTNTLLLAGVTILFGAAGTTLYASTAAGLAGASTVTLTAAAVLITVGLAFKLGAFPSHTWVPDVAQGAPAPAAAFLTVAPKVAAIVALARIVSLLPDGAVGWRALVAGAAALTMTVGNLSALWQDDVRRLLGWSSVSQAGYALMAIPVLGRSPDALPALLFFVTAYAAAQLAAFGVVTELRGRTALEDYRGLAGRRPLLAVALGLALLSFVGIPPLGGFTGKLLLFTAAIDGGYAWLAAVAVANTVVSLFYYLRVLAPVVLDDQAGPVPVLGRWAAVGTAAATTMVVGLGLGAQPFLHAAASARLLP